MATNSRSKIAWIAFLLVLTVSIVSILFMQRDSREDSAVFHEAVVGLKNLGHNGGATKDGFWVGDVAELYRLGVISKEVAEADIAPIRPLVSKPRPFHGYHVVAMETAPHPESWNEETVSLKGLTRSKDNFAFCIYPIERGRKRHWIYIVTCMGMFGRESTSDQPIMKWPTGDWRREWAIID